MTSAELEAAYAKILELEQTIVKQDLEISELRANLAQSEQWQQAGWDDSASEASDHGYGSHSTNEWGESTSSEESNTWPDSATEEPTEASAWTADTESAGEWEKRACRQCNDIDAAVKDGSDTSLKARSRLEDTRFYSNDPISQCRVPFKRQCYFMRSGLGSARITAWDAFRTHWPEEQRRHYLDGPQSVGFGVGELEPVFGDRVSPKYTANMCGDADKGYHAMAQVIDLRNALAHPKNLTSHRIDTLLKGAQALAVTFANEKHAFKIRQLRDELQQDVRKSFAIIEKRQTERPKDARPWAVYHQRMFNDLRKYGLESAEYPDVVLLAAMEWCEKNDDFPGGKDPEFLAAVRNARAKSYGVSEDSCDE